MEESEKLEVEKDPDLSQEIEFLREEIYRMEIAQQDQAQKIAQHLNEEEKSRWLENFIIIAWWKFQKKNEIL